MENKCKSVQINLEDIKTFLKKVGNFDNKDINSIYMGLLINKKKKFSEQSGDLPKDKKYLIIQNNEDETIDELAILFYNRDKCNRPITYKRLILMLCKDSKGKLYFECNNWLTEIEVETIEKNKKEDVNSKTAKKNEFAFGEKIFFGNRIDHLIYAIYNNNKKFIDFNDAQTRFEFLFCEKDLKGLHADNRLCYLGSNYSVDYKIKGTEKNSELKIFIRHENYKNISSNYCKLNGYIGYIDINELQLPEQGYVEIDVKENNDTTGFKYKLTDCNGNLISYAIDDQSKSEVLRLTNYIYDECNKSEIKDFVGRFDLGIYYSEVVLKDTVKGIHFMDCDAENCNCVCLGANTKLTFTKEFLNELKRQGKSNNKFYVLPKSQALQDILNFIVETRLVPCEALFFINEKIVKSYNAEKRISYNIDEKDLPKLCSDNLIKVSKIDSNFERVFSEVFENIGGNSSDFKTDDICKILAQVEKNAKKKKKNQITNLEENVKEFETYLKRFPNSWQIKHVYENMKKKLEEEKNKCPNQESRTNYENENRY